MPNLGKGFTVKRMEQGKNDPIKSGINETNRFVLYDKSGKQLGTVETWRAKDNKHQKGEGFKYTSIKWDQAQKKESALYKKAVTDWKGTADNKHTTQRKKSGDTTWKAITKKTSNPEVKKTNWPNPAKTPNGTEKPRAELVNFKEPTSLTNQIVTDGQDPNNNTNRTPLRNKKTDKKNPIKKASNQLAPKPDPMMPNLGKDFKIQRLNPGNNNHLTSELGKKNPFVLYDKLGNRLGTVETLRASVGGRDYKLTRINWNDKKKGITAYSQALKDAKGTVDNTQTLQRFERKTDEKNPIKKESTSPTTTTNTQKIEEPAWKKWLRTSLKKGLGFADREITKLRVGLGNA